MSQTDITPRKITCQFCTGSGQVHFFKGVSRFLISTEECPECLGLGFIIATESKSNNENDDRVE